MNKKLETTGFQIVLVINKKFVGTLTDGDIRSGILKGKPKNTVKGLTNKSPITVKPNENKNLINKLMIGTIFQIQSLKIKKF